MALRQSFFHNGVFHALRKAVEFYATRDSNSGRWYPRNEDGSVHKFDDLPPQYWRNLSDEPPFDGRQPGDPPALSEAEIDDVVAFLKTLTDGYGALDQGDNPVSMTVDDRSRPGADLRSR